jgi:hypothetical protein
VLPRIGEVFAYLPEDMLPSKRGLTWTFPVNAARTFLSSAEVKFPTLELSISRPADREFGP